MKQLITKYKIARIILNNNFFKSLSMNWFVFGRRGSKRGVSYNGVFFMLSVFLIFSFIVSGLCFASIADDLIARKGWKKISMDLNNAPLLSVLKVFSQQSGLNFVATSNIENIPITLYLEDVPIRKALEKILDINNLAIELDEESNMFIIKRKTATPLETITKTYQLKYVRVSNVADKGSEADSIVTAVSQRLSEEGKISTDARTNSLIISDVPERFSIIEETIKHLDIPIPQVFIEVEIIDVKQELLDQLGIQWTSTLYNLKFAGRTLSFPFQKWADKFAANGGDRGREFTTGSITIPTDTPTAVLQLLKTDASTRILARPKILTLSNQPAEIKIASQEAVGTIANYNDNGNLQSISAERVEVGVILNVTPFVNAELGEVTMYIEPKVSNAIVSNLSNNYFDPHTREAKTTVRIKDGDTLVIGGLLKKDEAESKKKLPLLGDIPFVGALFRHKYKDIQDRELLVFITPHIMSDEGQKTLAKNNSNDYQILLNREQKDTTYRKEEVDNFLDNWKK